MKTSPIKHLVFLIIVTLMTWSCNPPKPISPLRGKVKYETIAINNKTGGRVKSIFVEEGQEVKKGDTLAIVDLPEVDAKRIQAEGVIQAAKGQLDLASNGATDDQINQINGKLDAGRAQLDFARESFNRMEAMYQDSLISRQKFDEVKMKLRMAESQVSALEAKLDEVMKGTRSEQISQAKGQLNQAIGVLREVESAEDERFLIAPVDMTIETITLREGELLSPGYVLINGYDKESLYFRFTVPESDIYEFTPGQKLTIVNPYTEKEYAARLANVKQLTQYADVTSTSPLYKLSESIYELKVVPLRKDPEETFFVNATMLIKTK